MGKTSGERKKVAAGVFFLKKSLVPYGTIFLMFSLFKKSQTKFISGRISDRSEVNDGFFCLRSDLEEIISEPYKIKIPQSAVHIDPKTGKERTGILIQAEKVTKTKMKGDVICALRLKDGSSVICQLKELKLSEK